MLMIMSTKICMVDQNEIFWQEFKKIEKIKKTKDIKYLKVGESTRLH